MNSLKEQAIETMNTIVSEKIANIVRRDFEGWNGTIRAFGYALDVDVTLRKEDPALITEIPMECLKEAQAGRQVLVVMDSKYQFSEDIGNGCLFVRNFKLNGLKSVSVDIVYLIGNVPDDVATLATERCRASLIGEVRRLP